MPLRPKKHTINRALGRLIPWLVLATMLGITAFAWRHEQRTSQQVMRTQLQFALRDTVSRVEQRVQGYEQMLRGVQSLFATTHWHDRQAIRDYVEALQLDANFAGIQAIGMVDWVPAKDLTRHIGEMRKAGFRNYTIEPPSGQREAFAPIVQREPYIGKNRAPLGSDVWTDPTRRVAMERARDSGLPAISGKVRLRIDDGMTAPPAGFVMYLPIYSRGKAHDTLAQRRAHLVGWVYASFHMNDFMASLYGGQTPGLGVTIYDDTQLSEASLLYQSEPGQAQALPALAEAREYMVVAGNNWTLGLRPLAAFLESHGRNVATEIALAGSVLSALLGMLAWLLIHGRATALRLAAEMTREIRQMAQHDALTGLPNRALFEDRLGQELARAKRQNGRFAMLFVDLDKFKAINDNFGHAGGDQALKSVAERLRHSVRASDTVGRVGGDEFVVLLAQLSESDAIMELAEKVRAALKPSIVINDRELHVSCSIGVAVYPHDGVDVDSLTKRADDAMYKAKAAGRDCVQLS